MEIEARAMSDVQRAVEERNQHQSISLTSSLNFATAVHAHDDFLSGTTLRSRNATFDGARLTSSHVFHLIAFFVFFKFI